MIKIDEFLKNYALNIFYKITYVQYSLIILIYYLLYNALKDSVQENVFRFNYIIRFVEYFFKLYEASQISIICCRYLCKHGTKKINNYFSSFLQGAANHKHSAITTRFRIPCKISLLNFFLNDSVIKRLHKMENCWCKIEC